MDTMPMPGGGTMSTLWMPMCGQGWIDAAARSRDVDRDDGGDDAAIVVPLLWRYRQSVGGADELPARC